MVKLIRSKDADFKTEDVSSVGVAIGRAGQSFSKVMQGIGNRITKEEQAQEKDYQDQVQDNIKTEKARLDQQQKAFDASDKLIASDRAGRLENDLLRWNLEQRQNNPNYIGSPDHEKAMRDYYAKLSEKYSQGLGEVGKGEFTSKTQNAVNQMIGNDVKWAYQQKIKQGEESAKNIAQSMNDTAGMYGANGDIQGFKDSHKENREKLKEYAENAMPAGSGQALQELDKKSLVNFYTNLAQTDPVKAKALLDSMENFKETVPDDMLENKNDIISQAVNRDLNDKLILMNAGIENTKKGSPQRKELEKQKKKLEKEIKKAQEEDYSEKSLGEIHKEVSDAVAPVLEKSLGESALIAKQEHEADKVARFQEFMTLPTPENLKWFEEDNQMSYAQPEENMSKIPSDFFSYGDQSTLKDYYDIYKGRYANSGKAIRETELGLTDMLNEIGLAEDDAQIQYFDKIDEYKKQGVSEEKAIEKVFNDNPNNKFGDISTLQDFYDMSKGRYSDSVKVKEGLTDMLNNLGIAEDDAQIQFFDKIDDYKKQGMSEDEAVEKVFNDNPDNKFGDVSTLMDFYDMSKGVYDDDDRSVLANANKKDLERIDELVSGGLSEEKAIEQVFNETEKKIAEKEKANRNKQLIDNMLKYRENFGNVSMVEISDYKGTKQMFDDLKTVAQTDSDKDGNVDNVLLKSLVALNNAKQQEISETDYNNYQNIVNKALWDRTFKNELNQFINRTENFMPKQFWNKNSNVAFTSNRERLNEKMESKSRDVLSAVLKEWNAGKSGVDVAQMYREGIQKAYNEVASEALGINMEQVLADYKQYGFSLVNINGRDYSFNGVDSNGNPIWKSVSANGMSAQKLVESAKKVMNKKGE